MEWWIILLIVLGSLVVFFPLCRLVAVCCIYKKNKYHPDLKGYLVVVTGGTSGIGKQTAISLYRQGATLVTCGRNCDTLESEIMNQEGVTAELGGTWDQEKNYTGKAGRLYFRKIHLDDLKQVERFAEFCKTIGLPLKLLINNAGLAADKYKTTPQGLEMQMGVNYLSHYYLTELLFPLLQPESRIINVSSMIHSQVKAPKEGESLDYLSFFHCKSENYGNLNQYSKTKLCQVIFTAATQRILQANNLEVKTVSLHPGMVRTPFITRGFSGFANVMSVILYPIGWALFMNEIEGAQTTLHCANVPFSELKGGQYYSSCKVSERSKLVTQANEETLLGISNSLLNSLVGHKTQWLVYPQKDRPLDN